jgi:hypothetical protein
MDQTHTQTTIIITNVSLMNKQCINIKAYSQHILHEDTLYNINRQKYKTVCAELPFIKDIFDRLAMSSKG